MLVSSENDSFEQEPVRYSALGRQSITPTKKQTRKMEDGDEPFLQLPRPTAVEFVFTVRSPDAPRHFLRI